MAATPTDARALLAAFWNEAWTDGLWAAAWSKSVDGLTPQQAAWSPAPGRHSIWQIVLHMIFWRENELRRFNEGVAPTEAQIAAGNFPTIGEISEHAWADTRARLADTHQKIAAALADPSRSLDRARYLIPHDAYHFGQINYLRALQNLPPIE